MKTTDPTILAALDAPQVALADCYTINLAGGGVAYYTHAGGPITLNGNVYLSSLNIERSQLSQKTGLDVSSVALTVYPKSTDLLDGEAWLPAAKQGQLDNAIITIDRAVMTAPSQPPVGSIPMFNGRVADVQFGRTKLTITVNAPTEILTRQIPRNTFQSGCNNSLYDAHCAVNKAAYQVNAPVEYQTGSHFFYAPLAGTTDRHFDQGILTFLTGANAGRSRSVRRFLGNPLGNGYSSFELLSPFPVIPAIGDYFAAYPGCDKSIYTCLAKFQNQERFRGFPYVPAPQTAA